MDFSLSALVIPLTGYWITCRKYRSYNFLEIYRLLRIIHLSDQQWFPRFTCAVFHLASRLVCLCVLYHLSWRARLWRVSYHWLFQLLLAQDICQLLSSHALLERSRSNNFWETDGREYHIYLIFRINILCIRYDGVG